MTDTDLDDLQKYKMRQSLGCAQPMTPKQYESMNKHQVYGQTQLQDVNVKETTDE